MESTRDIKEYADHVSESNSELKDSVKGRDIMVERLQQEIENHVEMENTLGIVTESLFKEKWETLNMLCDEYYELGESDKTKDILLKNIEKGLKRISDRRNLSVIENSVDRYMGNIVIRLRVQCPFLKEDDIVFLTLIYAGYGRHDSSDSDVVWPHEAFVWELTDESFVFDGVAFEQYACAPEHAYKKRQPDGIGTFTHEFSHVLGLPDIYSLPWIPTPGKWSILDNGSDNNESRTPSNYSSFERGALGWLEFLPFKEGENTIPDLAESNQAYYMPTENENEYFFFENRQQRGNDTYLPGHGMLVWHLDYDENVWTNLILNSDEEHQQLDIVEADNNTYSNTTEGDTFPGTGNVTSFGFKTTPRLARWNGDQLKFDLENITETEEGLIHLTAVDTKSDIDKPDGVAEITTSDKEPEYYDLLGRRILHPAPGQIYFHKGKKSVFFQD